MTPLNGNSTDRSSTHLDLQPTATKKQFQNISEHKLKHYYKEKVNQKGPMSVAIRINMIPLKIKMGEKIGGLCPAGHDERSFQDDLQMIHSKEKEPRRPAALTERVEEEDEEALSSFEDDEVASTAQKRMIKTSQRITMVKHEIPRVRNSLLKTPVLES